MTSNTALNQKLAKARKHREERRKEKRKRKELALKLLRRQEEIMDQLSAGVSPSEVGKLESELKQLRSVIMQLGFSPKTYLPPTKGPRQRIIFVQGGGPGTGKGR